MIGTRAFTDEEVKLLQKSFDKLRDKLFLTLGVKTGFRASELLSLKIEDLYQHNELKSSITVTRRSMKGRHESRTVPLGTDVLRLLECYLKSIPTHHTWLFESRKQGRAISRVQAWRLIKQAADKNKLKGKIGTHSARKTFAKKVHEKLNKDVFKTQIALGHKSPSSTIRYLSFDQSEIDDAILDI